MAGCQQCAWSAASSYSRHMLPVNGEFVLLETNCAAQANLILLNLQHNVKQSTSRVVSTVTRMSKDQAMAGSCPQVVGGIDKKRLHRSVQGYACTQPS